MKIKNFYIFSSIANILLTMMVLVFISIDHEDQKAQISSLNREKEVHWMLPKNAECRIKAMYFRDSNNKTYQADRQVCERDELKCHWSMP